MLPETKINATLSGLSQAEAEQRLKADGYNELPSSHRRPLWKILLEVLLEPMFLLLLAAGSIYLLLGDLQDALMLLGFICIVMGITIFQQHRTERVLEALRDLTSPRALVVRDGMARRIPGREVVRGDLLILSEGDRVAADAILLECHFIKADESLLTGESVAVRKIACPADNGRDPEFPGLTAPLPGGDDQPHVYAGTLIVQGQGTARVMATGAASEIGKVGRALHEVALEHSPLQTEINRLVRWLAILGATLSLALALIYAIVHQDWMHGLLSGITLSMTLLPEEYPVVLIVFLAMGAWRISRHQILTRRMPAVEALGATTVLCVDKTGTLTFNRMSVQMLSVNGHIHALSQGDTELPEAFHELLEYAVLSSAADPFDPMEKAIQELAGRYLSNTEHLHRDWIPMRDYELTPQQLALSRVWKSREFDEYVVANKGAPEAVADLCHLDPAQLATLEKEINVLAAQGMRVLAVARATYSGPQWPAIQHEFEFRLVGLIGLADPVRPTVNAALEECRSAGIRVVMITGDYPATAAAIARQISLDAGPAGILSGAELEQMNDDTLQHHIRQCNIFARMVPQQKLRLVNALKAENEVVAMTGDGVNDAPALKAAHIGIAMGGRGTDVAREAAALVLVNDDFASIVQGIRLGRVIFDNMRKAIAYIFAVHIPIVGLSFFPLLFGWPAILFPIHIVFLEMIINPACSIAFEAEPADANTMQRPPRNVQEPLFNRNTLLSSLAQGCIVMLAALFIPGLALQQGVTADTARALAFITIVTGNLGLILANRSSQAGLLAFLRKPNPALWWIMAGSLTTLLLALTVPVFQTIFHFAPVSTTQFVLAATAGLAGLALTQLYKISNNRQPIEK